MIQLVVIALLLGATTAQATGGVVLDGSRLLVGSSSTTIEQFRRSLTSDESWQGFNAFIQITLDQTSVRTTTQTLLTYWSEECPSTEQVFRLSLASVNGTHLRGEFAWLNIVYFKTKWLPYEAGQVTTLMMHFNPDAPGGTVDGGRRSSFNMVVSSGRFSEQDFYSKYRSEQENSWSAVNVKATSGKGEIRIGGKKILQEGTNTVLNPFYGVVSFVSFHGAFIKASASRLSIINDPVEFLKPPFDSSFQFNPYAPQGGYYFLNSSFLSVSGGVTYYTGTAYRTAEADTTRYPVRLDVVGAPPAAPTDASTSTPTDASTSAPTTAADNNGTVSPPRGNPSTALSINGTGFLVMLALSILSIIIA